MVPFPALPWQQNLLGEGWLFFGSFGPSMDFVRRLYAMLPLRGQRLMYQNPAAVRHGHKKFPSLILSLFFFATGLWGRPADSYQDLMDKAREAQLAGNADQAAGLYRAALRLQPHSGPAEYGLGLMESVHKNYHQAIDLLSQALRDDPSIVDAYLFRGIALFNIQQPAQALLSLERFHRLRPTDPNVPFYLAGAYNALQNYPKAADYYLAQTEITPERTELWYFLGECLLNIARGVKENLLNGPRGKYDEQMLYGQEEAAKGDVTVAERDFREAIKADPASPEAYVNLGNLLIGEGKHAEAKEQFQEALQRAPQNCRAVEGLGDAELAMGDAPASVAAYAKVAGAKEVCIEEPAPANLGLSPAEFDIRVKSVSAYGAAAKWKLASRFELSRLRGHTTDADEPGASKRDGAPQLCRSAIPNPEWLSSPKVDLFVANCLEDDGDFRAAIKALNAAEPRLNGDLDTAYWTLSLYMRLAQGSFVELAKQAPDSYLLSEVQAETFELEGRNADADAEYRKAIAASGNDPNPFIDFGRFKCKRNELDDAITVLNGALARAPDNLAANDLMGQALFMKGDYESAIPRLKNAIKVNPGNEDDRIRLAESLGKLGRNNEAVVLLQAAPNDDDGRVHYVLAGYYRREGKKEEMQQALAYFETRQKAIKTKAVKQPN
jgi:tetratricopeptide (TPR) repeat protein